MRDAVIVDVVRSPVGRRRGALSGVHPVDLLGYVLAELVKRNHLDPERVDDVIVGCVDQNGEQSVNVARNAWLAAGLPESVPATTVDRQCGSSLQAVHFAAQGVLAGAYDIVIAAGVESMTRVPMGSNLANGPGTPMTAKLQARYPQVQGWFSQAVGAELIAKRWGFTREDLDRFSYESHMRASRARESGRLAREILPVPVDRDGVPAWVEHDEGIRPDTTLEKMAALEPAFPGLELITAGNSSQISDGASACLIMERHVAERLGLRPRARFAGFAVVGVDPVTMLTGPIPVTRKVLERAGLELGDIDLFEVNEAFAPVVLAWQKEYGVPFDRLNVNGGAIALGHPLGATGTRLVDTLVNELEVRQARYGLIAICEGGGMANGTIIERVSE
ncbi:MAG: thiolase family protein [Actinomycetia bacterium]|nr:thiolase family protein [Actinomycetes bacterium]